MLRPASCPVATQFPKVRVNCCVHAWFCLSLSRWGPPLYRRGRRIYRPPRAHLFPFPSIHRRSPPVSAVSPLQVVTHRATQIPPEWASRCGPGSCVKPGVYPRRMTGTRDLTRACFALNSQTRIRVRSCTKMPNSSFSGTGNRRRRNTCL